HPGDHGPDCDGPGDAADRPRDHGGGRRGGTRPGRRAGDPGGATARRGREGGGPQDVYAAGRGERAAARDRGGGRSGRGDRRSPAALAPPPPDRLRLRPAPRPGSAGWLTPISAPTLAPTLAWGRR